MEDEVIEVKNSTNDLLYEIERVRQALDPDDLEKTEYVSFDEDNIIKDILLDLNNCFRVLIDIKKLLKLYQ